MPEPKEKFALDYQSANRSIWCLYCGDHYFLFALFQALASLGLESEELVFVSGIGCAGRLPYFINAYGFHVAHGRVLPVATGIKLTNPALTVFGIGGDGDGLSIGVGHFLHAARRNIDVTYVILDNGHYAQTKGQPSATTPLEEDTHAMPFGSPEEPLNPLALALISGAGFVARAFAGQGEGVVEVMRRAIQHRGFAFVQVLSPCPTFNEHQTYDFWSKVCRPLASSHDLSDWEGALRLAREQETLYTGVFYQESKPTFEDRLRRSYAEAKSAGGDWAALIGRFR